MIPAYQSTFSHCPIDLNEDQHQFFSSKPEEAASPSSSLSDPSLINRQVGGGGCYHKGPQPLRIQEELLRGGSCDYSTLKDTKGNGLKISVCKKEDRNENQGENSSVKWMSSKMRLMRKMMSSDSPVADTAETSMQKIEDQKGSSSPLQADSSSNNPIRVCADCNTTKTPLWRSGPRGPKSLCNACGIRQRKARRAMAAAAACANDGIFAGDAPTTKPNVQHKEKKTNSKHLPFKKRCKFTAQARGRKKLCVEDLTIILSENSAFHQRVFPQDEKEAAILLMALSYGLVHG